MYFYSYECGNRGGVKGILKLLNNGRCSTAESIIASYLDDLSVDAEYIRNFAKEIMSLDVNKAELRAKSILENGVYTVYPSIKQSSPVRIVGGLMEKSSEKVVSTVELTVVEEPMVDSKSEGESYVDEWDITYIEPVSEDEDEWG